MLNKVQLIGRLGKKPEVNYILPDVPVARYTLATSEPYKSKDGEWIDQTEWHNIVSWRNNAKYAENYLDKGILVFIEGKLQTRSWEKDGITRYSTEIVTNQIKILEKKSNSTETKYQNTNTANNTATEQTITNSITNEDNFAEISPELNSNIEDDLPF